MMKKKRAVWASMIVICCFSLVGEKPFPYGYRAVLRTEREKIFPPGEF
jgi:hypothetical protein